MNVTLRPHLASLALLLLLTGSAASAGPLRADGTRPHEGISCALCHGRTAARAETAAMPGTPDPQSRACRECHRAVNRPAAGVGTALGFHADAAADCVGCHLFHDAGRVRTAAGDLRSGDARLARATAGHCAACHTDGAPLGNLSPAHRAAAELYHRDASLLADQSPSEACLNCHAAGTSSPWLLETGNQVQTFSPHATHPLGIEVVAGSGHDERTIREHLDERLRLFEGRLECQTCHNLTAATPDLLVAFEQPYDLCLGCHQLRNPQPSTARRALVATMMAVE
ncbi:MAG: hypothetical protein IPK64_06415 [bacterium]|nr:hypothetical protein [bacterium]